MVPVSKLANLLISPPLFFNRYQAFYFLSNSETIDFTIDSGDLAKPCL
jgi:hypothetical protein